MEKKEDMFPWGGKNRISWDSNLRGAKRKLVYNAVGNLEVLKHKPGQTVRGKKDPTQGQTRKQGGTLGLKRHEG